MLWQISSFPKCEHHVFLSHCAEDRDTLVLPVYQKLLANGILPWLDREDYYYGRDSRAALRDGLLNSRHVVFFVTHAMLSTARGWCVFELAFTELIELSFQVTGGQLANLFLPVFLISQNDDRLPRTVWQAVRDRGIFYDSSVDGERLDWCVGKIREFLVREQKLARNMAAVTRSQEPFAERLKQVPGLFDRVVKFHPKRIPNEQ